MYAHQTPGEAGDFGDLYARYRSRLIRYCGRRLGRDEAEDAAHEVLLRALQAWDRFDASSDAWPWLATIASHVCADARRRAARPVVAPGHELAADVHEQVAARMRATILEAALGRLPPRYRNPLVLKEYGGWSYRDIAELEGRTVSSVRSRIMRSRRHLTDRVESVARSQGQWPLPAAVPRLVDEARVRARRGHVVRTWLERVAQTAVAVFNSNIVAGVVTSPAAQAVVPSAAVAAAAVAAVVIAAPPAIAEPLPERAAASVPHVAVRTDAPGGGAHVSADVGPAVPGEVPDIRTVVHIDDHVPENPVVGIKEIDVTAHYRADSMTISVSNFYTWPIGEDTDEPQATNVPCRTSTEKAACAAVKDGLAAVEGTEA